MSLFSPRISLLLILTLLFGLGCGLTPRKSSFHQTARQPTQFNATEEAGQENVIEEVIRVETLSLVEENQVFASNQSEPSSVSEKKVSQSIHRIPVQINKEVRKWIDYFSIKDRARFQRFLNRGSRYREVVENVLKENGLPAELYYLAMIESGYQNHATSRASAVGVWQFIRGTGRRYGLEINHHVDERRDPIRATEAAVRYLRDLHNVFGSWHLAMAGYNAGEYRVVRAVFKGKTRDFWKLVALKALPPETRNYIPKFLAAVEIGQNPLKYGFTEAAGEKYPNLQAVRLPNSVSLRDISSYGGLSLSELKKVNPHLLRSHTPPGRRGYDVWVPLAAVKKLNQNKASLQRKAKKVQVHVARSPHYHRVRRGDNLSSIARRYGMSLGQLKKLNRLRSNRIYVGARLKVRRSALTSYRVQRGDNLSSIARRYGMSLRQLKKLNRLRSNRIHVGARLKVQSSKENHMTRYRVKPGDNLTEIAQRFGTSVSALKEINSIRNNTIFPGQVLHVSL